MPRIIQNSIIELEDVSFAYGVEGGVCDINLNILKGEYVGVIGPNGGGKTTLIKLILGLLTPQQGIVKLFGEPLTTFRQWDRIGYVSQQATRFDQHFPATVEEVVLMGRFAKKGLFRQTNDEDRTKAKAALKQVGLTNVSSSLIGDLSGGQQQRVFIARALASEPEILILDEPTTGVDEATQKEFYALLRELHKEKTLTLLFVSHDVSRIRKEMTRVIEVNHHVRSHA